MSLSKPDFSVAPGAEIVSDSRCFVCGQKNVGGLQVRFFRKDALSAEATCSPQGTFMGYDGLLHGGVAASLLDEVMIKAVLACGKIAVTARMSVSYHRPIPLRTELRLHATIVSQKGRVCRTEGQITDESGRLLCSATGTYVEMTGLRRAKLEQSLGG